MEVGQVNNRQIVAVIQARYASVRLPGKVLLPLPMPKGKSTLEHIVTTLQRNPLIGQIVIASSNNPENDPIQSLADRLQIACFRGKENDVLSRFVSILADQPAAYCLRLTGDNPLVDNTRLSEAIGYIVQEGLDYIYTCGLPLGMNFEIFKSQALLKCQDYVLTEQDREHVTPFLRESGKFKTAVYKYAIDKELSNLRCTIDYPADFAFMNLLMSLIDPSADRLIEEISVAHARFPCLAEINADSFQKMPDLSVADELSLAMDILRKYDLNRAVTILKKHS